MEPASAEKLLKAFEIFDTDGSGKLSKEHIGKLMTEEGEPFTQVNFFLSYLYYCHVLTCDYCFFFM